MINKPTYLLFGAAIAALITGCVTEATNPGNATQDHSQHSMSGVSNDELITNVRHDKYEINLRVPEEGIFAGEQIDVEFRITDTTKKDPVEGDLGVANVKATGTVVMPSMMGMPEQKPNIHREGIPGDYGIELYFPHGGIYEIRLTLTPPEVQPFNVVFRVDVKDGRDGSETASLPYSLMVVDWPTPAQSGVDLPFRLRVIDNKDESIVTKFDVAHEKEFHLLIASKDLNWFIHEHPVMQPDGTWTIPIQFPAGGEYWIYGDVAPTGKGSNMLVTSVTVEGPAPTWSLAKTLTLSGEDGGVKGQLAFTDGQIPVGRSTELVVSLTDSSTGRPVSDTQPWLGAAGHLMIIHEDGQTVVHSHPGDSPEDAALVREGKIRFNARFPKTGYYKAYTQFQRNGVIKTIGFGFEVK
ncbi:MAG: FixH family protein [Fimbriimonadaceae bacterium]|nr:FixH family protein [Fimbriimonadaceae bacterium]